MLTSRWLIVAACLMGLPGCTLNSVGAPSENGETTKTEDFVELDSPPVLLLSREQVATLREDPDLERAAAPIIRLAEEAIARAPTPLKKIIYGGRVSSDPERIQSTRQLRDMTLLDALAWAPVGLLVGVVVGFGAFVLRLIRLGKKLHPVDQKQHSWRQE